MRMLGECFTRSAREVGRARNSATLVHREGGAKRCDRLARTVRGHAPHQGKRLCPGSHRFISSRLRCEAVTEISVCEGMDPLVRDGIPADESFAVPLFRSDVVGEGRQCTGGMAGNGALGRTADEREAGLWAVASCQSVFG